MIRNDLTRLTGEAQRSCDCLKQEPTSMHTWTEQACRRYTYGAQEINIQNMNVELVAQMFNNYQSNVRFHLEGSRDPHASTE